MPNPVETLDLRDHVCSEPVVKTKVALERLESGESIEVLANDSAREDITRIFGRIQKNFIEISSESDHVRILITKK